MHITLPRYSLSVITKYDLEIPILIPIPIQHRNRNRTCKPTYVKHPKRPPPCPPYDSVPPHPLNFPSFSLRDTPSTLYEYLTRTTYYLPYALPMSIKQQPTSESKTSRFSGYSTVLDCRQPRESVLGCGHLVEKSGEVSLRVYVKDLKTSGLCGD